MGEYQESESTHEPVMVPSGDALFGFAENHMPGTPEPTPFVAPTSRFTADEKHSAAHEDLGYSHPFEMPSIDEQRAIVGSGGGSREMRANVARANDKEIYELLYGAGPVDPRTPEQEQAAREDAVRRFNERVERKVREKFAEGMPYGAAYTESVAQTMAYYEILRRSA